MSGLLELQRRMGAAVMQPLSKSDTMRPRNPQGRSNAKEAAEFIKPNSRLTSFERLEIYNRQYWFRILDSFAEDFPGLRAVVGRKRFDEIARGYLTECPSESFTLRNLGSRLPQWLADHKELTGGHYALAADMLKLEWAHIEAFDAADLTPLSLEELAALGDDPRLSLQPHISLIEVHFPVDDLLLAVRDHENEQQETGGNRSFSIRGWLKPASRKAISKINAAQHREREGTSDPANVYIAIHRANYSVHYKRLDRESYLLLNAVRENKSLGDALEIAFGESALAPEEQAARVQDWFAHWMSLGWFVSPALTSLGDTE